MPNPQPLGQVAAPRLHQTCNESPHKLATFLLPQLVYSTHSCVPGRSAQAHDLTMTTRTNVRTDMPDDSVAPRRGIQMNLLDTGESSSKSISHPNNQSAHQTRLSASTQTRASLPNHPDRLPARAPRLCRSNNPPASVCRPRNPTTAQSRVAPVCDSQ